MKHGRLLLVDDDRHIVESTAGWLRGQGYFVATANSVTEAKAHLTSRDFDIVLSDIRLQDGDGFELLAHCRRERPDLSVILLTGYGTVETGVEAIRAGAFDLLIKPLLDDELELSIDRALSQREVVEHTMELAAQLDLQFGMENIIGTDVRMRKVFEIVDSVADARATVLITGENGTGKSLVARALHRRSVRRDHPFVEVACGALPETLLESELFGHTAGAFTGALHERVGKFAQAHNGTIFLDEIGTASPSMQVKLLRVLQDFEFERIGGNDTCQVDARVILATNENLQMAVAEGQFRQDLFYRINVINIELPPLRERAADIPMLAQHFLKEACGDASRRVHGFTEESLAAICRYSWPGNVRELQNVVERAVLLGKHEQIRLEDLPPHLVTATPRGARPVNGRTLKEALEGPERQIILEVLREHNWNRNLTAESLGINRTTLYKKMKRLGLDDPRQLSLLSSAASFC